MDSTDDKQAYTDNWNVTISRQLPWSSILEVSYIGNRSEDIPSSGNGGSCGLQHLNINLVPIGAMLASKNGGVDPNYAQLAELPSPAGLRRPVRGHEQRACQLQRLAGGVGAHEGALHHQSELHV